MNNDENKILDEKVEATILIFRSLYTIFGGCVFSFFTFWIFVKGADTFTKVAILPFLICGLAVLINGISSLVQAINTHRTITSIENGSFYDESKAIDTHEKMEKVNRFSNNLYLYGFLTFWFGFLIVFDYLAIRDWSDGGEFMFYFSLVFWAAGIFMLFTKRK